MLKSISHKFAAIALLIYVTTAMIVAGYIYWDATKTSITQAHQKLAAFEQIASAQADFFKDRYISEISILSQTSQLVTTVWKFASAVASDLDDKGVSTDYIRQTYIDANPNPIDQRDNFFGPTAGEKTAYDRIHALEHEWMRDFVNQRADLLDALIASSDGTIVYSVKKSPLFAENLSTSTSINTLLANAFAEAEQLEKGDDPVFSGYFQLQSDDNVTSAFLLQPVWDTWGKKVGYLILQLSQQPLLDIFDEREELGAEFHALVLNADLDVIFSTPRTADASVEGIYTSTQQEVFNRNLAASLLETGEDLPLDPIDGSSPNSGSVIEVQGAFQLFDQQHVSVWQLPRSEVLAMTHGLLTRIGLIFLVSTVLFGSAIVLASRSITSRLGKLQEFIQSITESKDLSKRLESSTGDEVGQSSAALNSFLDALEEFVSAVKTGALEMDSVSDDLLEASRKLSLQSEAQAAAIEELSSSLEETEAQAAMALETTGKATSDFEEAKQSAAEGNKFADRMKRVSGAISKSTEDISGIIKLIDNIAFQTNLLALNAAVEAARAGVHGRGFSVVAQEVGNLAKKSAEAAAQSEDMIKVVLARISDGEKASVEANAAFESITEKVTKAASGVADINGNSREQVSCMQSASTSAVDLANKTYETTERSNETFLASENLKKHAAKLSAMANSFYVSNKQKPIRKNQTISVPKLSVVDSAAE